MKVFHNKRFIKITTGLLAVFFIAGIMVSVVQANGLADEKVIKPNLMELIQDRVFSAEEQGTILEKLANVIKDKTNINLGAIELEQVIDLAKAYSNEVVAEFKTRLEQKLALKLDTAQVAMLLETLNKFKTADINAFFTEAESEKI